MLVASRTLGVEKLTLGAAVEKDHGGERGTDAEGPSEKDQPPAQEDPRLSHGASSESTYPTPRIVWISFVGNGSSIFVRR